MVACGIHTQQSKFIHNNPQCPHSGVCVHMCVCVSACTSVSTLVSVPVPKEVPTSRVVRLSCTTPCVLCKDLPDSVCWQGTTLNVPHTIWVWQGIDGMGRCGGCPPHCDNSVVPRLPQRHHHLPLQLPAHSSDHAPQKLAMPLNAIRFFCAPSSHAMDHPMTDPSKHSRHVL